jgi:hypothetical protein
MSNDLIEPPCYYKQQGGGYQPTKFAANPWFENAIAGGPLSALIGHVIEQAGFDPSFNVVRITIDILGRVPSALLEARVIAVRQGRQMQLHRIELLSDGKLVTQAHVLLCRQLETPLVPAPFDYPAPETLEDSKILLGASMAGAIRTRPIMGGVREPGRGVIWIAMDGQIVEGITPSPFLKACLFADFGNGVGSSTDAREWSFANLDINIQFLRMPVGEWLLLDAHTIGGGNGHALAENLLADRDGVFAKGTQTVFVAPASAGITLRAPG